MKIVLGTANFGSAYGAFSRGKKLDFKQASELVEMAHRYGIVSFDTATSYGDAQKILGLIRKPDSKIKVTSKIGREDCRDNKAITRAVLSSCKQLNVETLQDLLLHDPLLLFETRILNSLEQLTAKGLVDRVGVSIYTQEHLENALKRRSIIKTIQLPYSLLTRNQFEERDLYKATAFGMKIQIRSVFLQGLLLANTSDIPLKFSQALPKLQLFESLCHKLGHSKMKVLINYVKRLPWCSEIVVGVNDRSQLRGLIDAYNFDLDLDYNHFPTLDYWTSDPRNWS